MEKYIIDRKTFTFNNRKFKELIHKVVETKKKDTENFSQNKLLEQIELKIHISKSALQNWMRETNPKYYCDILLVTDFLGVDIECVLDFQGNLIISLDDIERQDLEKIRFDLRHTGASFYGFVGEAKKSNSQLSTWDLFCIIYKYKCDSLELYCTAVDAVAELKKQRNKNFFVNEFGGSL